MYIEKVFDLCVQLIKNGGKNKRIENCIGSVIICFILTQTCLHGEGGVYDL